MKQSIKYFFQKETEIITEIQKTEVTTMQMCMVNSIASKTLDLKLWSMEMEVGKGIVKETWIKIKKASLCHQF